MRWTSPALPLMFFALAACAEADPPPPRLTMDMGMMDMPVNPPGNERPVASPGTSQDVRVGSTVTLDGSQSFDSDGDPLTYLWTLSTPEGSVTSLSDATSAITKFDADVPGDYVVTLVVNDTKIDSAASSVRIRALPEMVDMNQPPVADAGLDRQVETGMMVQLDGARSSDPDSDPLIYAWTLVTRPSGSTAARWSPASSSRRPTWSRRRTTPTTAR